MSCAERDRLLNDYNRSMDEWAKAVLAKYERPVTSSVLLWVLNRGAEAARVSAMRAKATYTQHMNQHGCREQMATSADSYAAPVRTPWMWAATQAVSRRVPVHAE
jgi:hypothetical protein